VRFPGGLELGWLPAQPALGLGDGEPFAGTSASEVGLELGDHRQHGEQEPADWIGGVVDRAADVEPDATVGEFVDDVAGVWHRAGEPVELGDDQGVAFAAGGECFAESGSFTVRPGEAVVDVDPLLLDAEGGEAGPFGMPGPD